MSKQKLLCYISLSHSNLSERVNDAIVSGVKKAGFDIVSPYKFQPLNFSPLQMDSSGEIAESDCVIADISYGDPNVYFEIGLAQALGKPIFILFNELSDERIAREIEMFDIQIYSSHSNGILLLNKKIIELLTEFRKYPRKVVTLRSGFSSSFFADWDRLTSADTENLCKELLTQMGFKRIDWEKRIPEVDLVAELPKKDPDGFEYRELWLISVGQRGQNEMLLQMASEDPEYFLHRISRNFDESRMKSSVQITSGITILTIVPRKNSEMDDFELISEKMRRRSKRGSLGTSIRLRIWDQDYLTSLVHKFPQIGYKYFSDEGRLRSMTRKSYEDLYNENSDMLTEQRALIIELEEERNRRVSAERDAVWKDISFAAAHKIGNPIFAIETDLDPLLKRIKESRSDDAMEVVSNIRSAVEKAKGFVEQFKSLAKAQQITPISILLKLVLDDALRTICNQNIEVELQCPDDVYVIGDFDRLVECFDELIANSIHWFDKAEKNISIVAKKVNRNLIPTEVENNKDYVLIDFSDNGPGIPVVNKSNIFNAFFTTYEHGTGLGLALVRRIVDGHGGFISETGMPGKGANFEIYLPIDTKKDK